MTLLTPDEIELLTGYRRATEQKSALSQMGIPFVVRPDGRPVVRSDWSQTARSRKPILNVAAIR